MVSKFIPYRPATRVGTAASATQLCADTIRLGKYDIGIAIGMDKHPRGAFTDDPAKLALPAWYAENGQFVTTKFFGMKANKYLHDNNISVLTNMLDPNSLANVDRRKVESMTLSKVSMMPEGLLDTFNEDEVMDLMAYLLSRGDRNHAMFKK